ncbi:VC0807 family protein [Streptomyces cinnamoneus]|uniref:DUF3159 domain-containing protein n=1 Tax=Streptomyces cinnamoneus TaxID=53446 RepID=A0A918U0I2_STRCJ|nr:VC0807 family protein [Streptomyces cinnamoneus]GHC67973.1 hypothetical protein GCM10010507_52780 [Streptomyces cinnamoneus]
MSVQSSAPPSKGVNKATVLGWAVSIVFNVVLPMVTYQQLRDAGWSEFTALLVSGAWPVLDTVIHLIWQRRIDEFAVVTLIFMALTVIVTVVGPHSTRLLLVKESAVTGLFGVVCLVSLALPRPLMFYFGRKFGTDGTKEGLERWNGLWAEQPGFRRVMRTITTAWGVGYVVEAGTRIGLSYVLSTGTMVGLNSVLAYGVPVVLVTWTITYSKRARARGQAAMAAREAAAAAAAA